MLCYPLPVPVFSRPPVFAFEIRTRSRASMSTKHLPPLPPRPTDDASRAYEREWTADERLLRRKRAVIFTGVSLIGVALSYFCGKLANVQAPSLYLFALAGGLAVAAFATWFPNWFADASSRGFIAFLAPNHGTAPAEATYSHVQAIAARGDIAGALSQFESVIAADAAAVEARIQAAELYATTRTDVARAAALYAEVRRIEGVSPARDLYASQRLIDLYDGPLRQPARSLTELRRIIDRHQGSREAEYARATLARRRQEQTHSGEK